VLIERKTVKVGSVQIGGNSPISVQTMTNSDTENVDETVSQIIEAYEAGCDIIRVSCPTRESTTTLKEIIKNSPIPVVADIHFNYKRAIEAIESGAHCIRINPGNIEDHGIREIVACSKSNGNSIRIGINSGSIEREILEKHGEPRADALVESAVLNTNKLLDLEFENFKVSVKSSDVKTTIDAYRKIHGLINQPLHLGITEAGPVSSGTVKSAIGIGALLADGIGDTIRVSLSTKDITEEVRVGRQILKALHLLHNSIDIVACPTCARTIINVTEIAEKLEDMTSKMEKNLKISVMGCVVNGPGEAQTSDIGIFGFQNGIAKIYHRGIEIVTCDENEVVDWVTSILSKFEQNT
jgi:(E)-4-hydroxy-3-methylbut-2-enyl-diphosphate synthase